MKPNGNITRTEPKTVARPKVAIHVPANGTDGRPMTYIHVLSDTEWKEISRREFAKLVHDTPNSDEHIVPDFDGAVTYFVPDGEKYDQMSRCFSREADKERRRNERHYRCIYKGTDLCDGWTRDPDREHNCASCTRKYTSITISLEEAYKDDEGNIVDFGSAFHDDTVPSMEEIVQQRIDADILRSAIERLDEEDRKFLTDGLRVDMNYAKLGRMYGIDPRCAGRHIERIKEVLCKSCVKN